MIYHFFSGKYIHLSPNIIRSILSYADKTNQNGFDDIKIIVENTGNVIFKDKNSHQAYLDIAKEFNFKGLEIVTNKWKFLSTFFKIKSSDKIFLHSSQNIKMMTIANAIIMLFRMKKKAKSINYICWGDDFGFNRKLRNVNTLQLKLASYIYETVWPWYGGIITLIKKDKEKVENAYHISNVITAPYISNNRPFAKSVRDKTPIRIMVSHSGWPHNNHIESFKLIEKFKDSDIEIICPLCYGDNEYIENVIKNGTLIFGDKFKYFTDLKPFDEYCKIVQQCHVFITGAECQTGLGAIHISMRGNARIFLKEVLYDTFTEYGFKVFKYNSISTLSIEDLRKNMDEENLKKIKEIKDKQQKESILQWRDIYLS